MKAIKLASSEVERARLKSKCLKALARAEEIKGMKEWSLLSKKEETIKPKSISGSPVSSRPLSTREEVILLEGSKLHGLIFPPWKAEPSENFFDLTDGTLYK